jgi:hypothetical protein
MFKFLNFALILPVLMTVNTSRRSQAEVINYFNIPTNINFNYIEYQLTWSSHPNEQYYKHEYVAKDDKVERFNNMVLIDFIITDLPVIDVVRAKAAELTKRKKTDEICNFNLIKNPQNGDYILDFVLGEHSRNSLAIVEWNGYHYKSHTDKNGHKGVLLFGMSHRAYNDDSVPFLKILSGYRIDNLKALQTFSIPDIQLDK